MHPSQQGVPEPRLGLHCGADSVPVRQVLRAPSASPLLGPHSDFVLQRPHDSVMTVLAECRTQEPFCEILMRLLSWLPGRSRNVPSQEPQGALREWALSTISIVKGLGEGQAPQDAYPLQPNQYPT